MFGGTLNYISTRGHISNKSFNEILLSGLAPDGGLYLPASWPHFNKDELIRMGELPYPDLAFSIMTPFVGNELSDEVLINILQDAYSAENFSEIAPLNRISESEYLLELFHGPTLAFKDMAMQFLGPLFDYVLKDKGKRATIIGATSGDTGSAAIEACKNRDNIDIFILYPHGRISDIQRYQMTTVNAKNVKCIALDGTFDDCQDLVKAIFNDHNFSSKYNLVAINSINWGRILAQIVYYFWAALKFNINEHPVSFSVPTGNFGNVLAGYFAKKLGLPIKQLIVGSNRNDILTRFLRTGVMELTEVYSTNTPSMDIQISSNFERFLYLLNGQNGRKVSVLMDQFRRTGKFTIESETFKQVRKVFDGDSFDDKETSFMIREIFEKHNNIIDPHTAVGIAAARSKREDIAIPMISLATAHAAKFSDTVKAATGLIPELPEHLRDLRKRKETFTRLPNNLSSVKDFLTDTLSNTL